MDSSVETTSKVIIIYFVGVGINNLKETFALFGRFTVV